MEPAKVTHVNSRAKKLFVQLFCEAFGPDKTENLQIQYPALTYMAVIVTLILRWSRRNRRLP